VVAQSIYFDDSRPAEFVLSSRARASPLMDFFIVERMTAAKTSEDVPIV